MSVLYTKIQNIINTSDSDAEVGRKVKEYFNACNDSIRAIIECTDKYVSDCTDNQLEIQFDDSIDKL